MTDPIMIEIAAAVAAEPFAPLTDLVRSGFARNGRDTGALAAAVGTAPESAEVTALAVELARVSGADADFAESLRVEWAAARPTARRLTVHNTASGDIRGPVIQAGTIKGGIHFGR